MALQNFGSVGQTNHEISKNFGPLCTHLGCSFSFLLICSDYLSKDSPKTTKKSWTRDQSKQQQHHRMCPAHSMAVAFKTQSRSGIQSESLGMAGENDMFIPSLKMPLPSFVSPKQIKAFKMLSHSVYIYIREYILLYNFIYIYTYIYCILLNIRNIGLFASTRFKSCQIYIRSLPWRWWNPQWKITGTGKHRIWRIGLAVLPRKLT